MMRRYPDFMERVMFGCLQKARAYEQLHDPEHGGRLNAEGYYTLCLAAGMSEIAASKMASMRAYQRLSMDLPA